MHTIERRKAIAYRRVSTETQLDGFGLDIQTDAIDELVAGDDLDLVATFTDEGICGAEDIDVRLELGKALDYLAAHAGTVLIVPRLDRLARDLIVQEQLLADAWRTGADVLSCSPTERIYCQPDSPDDPARTLIRQVLGAVAAYERAMIRLRLSRGRRRRLAAEGWAGGPKPFGWDDPTERTILAHVDAARQFKRNGGPWTAAELQRTHARAAARAC